MPQKVVTESFRVAGMGSTMKFKPDSEVQKLLADGWRIITTSSAILQEAHLLFVTFVLEQVEAEPASNYKGLL